MKNVQDKRHIVVTRRIVFVWKSGTVGLNVLTSCHPAAVTFTFDDEGQRDEYFERLAKEIEAEP